MFPPRTHSDSGRVTTATVNAKSRNIIINLEENIQYRVIRNFEYFHNTRICTRKKGTVSREEEVEHGRTPYRRKQKKKEVEITVGG